MKKIQKIVIFYRRSPVRNDVLQDLVKDERGKELKLQKDCKTRWSSVMVMLRNFLEIRVQIHKDLSDRGKESMFPTPAEIDHTKSLAEALKIIAFLTAKLGARDMNLAKADEIFEFALEQLDQLDSPISDDLYSHMKARIIERRLQHVATLLGYLQNPKFLFGRRHKLPYSNKAEITDEAVKLYTRLFDSDVANDDMDTSDQGN